jgi:hypothetical protein
LRPGLKRHLGFADAGGPGVTGRWNRGRGDALLPFEPAAAEIAQVNSGKGLATNGNGSGQEGRASGRI